MHKKGEILTALLLSSLAAMVVGSFLGLKQLGQNGRLTLPSNAQTANCIYSSTAQLKNPDGSIYNINSQDTGLIIHYKFTTTDGRVHETDEPFTAGIIDKQNVEINSIYQNVPVTLNLKYDPTKYSLQAFCNQDGVTPDNRHSADSTCTEWAGDTVVLTFRCGKSNKYGWIVTQKTPPAPTTAPASAGTIDSLQVTYNGNQTYIVSKNNTSCTKAKEIVGTCPTGDCRIDKDSTTSVPTQIKLFKLNGNVKVNRIDLFQGCPCNDAGICNESKGGTKKQVRDDFCLGGKTDNLNKVVCKFNGDYCSSSNNSSTPAPEGECSSGGSSPPPNQPPAQPPAQPPSGSVCSRAGATCTDTYTEACNGGTHTCHKTGVCDAAGDGTHCSWGAGSYCDACSSANNPPPPTQPPPPASPPSGGAVDLCNQGLSNFCRYPQDDGSGTVKCYTGKCKSQGCGGPKGADVSSDCTYAGDQCGIAPVDVGCDERYTGPGSNTPPTQPPPANPPAQPKQATIRGYVKVMNPRAYTPTSHAITLTYENTATHAKGNVFINTELRDGDYQQYSINSSNESTVPILVGQSYKLSVYASTIVNSGIQSDPLIIPVSSEQTIAPTDILLIVSTPFENSPPSAPQTHTLTVNVAFTNPQDLPDDTKVVEVIYCHRQQSDGLGACSLNVGSLYFDPSHTQQTIEVNSSIINSLYLRTGLMNANHVRPPTWTPRITIDSANCHQGTMRSGDSSAGKGIECSYDESSELSADFKVSYPNSLPPPLAATPTTSSPNPPAQPPTGTCTLKNVAPANGEQIVKNASGSNIGPVTFSWEGCTGSNTYKLNVVSKCNSPFSSLHNFNYTTTGENQTSLDIDFSTCGLDTWPIQGSWSVSLLNSRGVAIGTSPQTSFQLRPPVAAPPPSAPGAPSCDGNQCLANGACRTVGKAYCVDSIGCPEHKSRVIYQQSILPGLCSLTPGEVCISVNDCNQLNTASLARIAIVLQQADLNNDGQVGIMDFFTSIQKFGQTVSVHGMKVKVNAAYISSIISNLGKKAK